MNKEHVATIQDATAKAVAAQVQRTLNVARIKGWKFPDGCAVAVKVLVATPLVTRISVRIDDVEVPQTDITPEAAARDISRIVDAMVAQWLAKHATEKPKRG